MELRVDLSTGGVTVDHHGDFSRLCVRAVAGPTRDSGDLGAVAAALNLHRAGTVDPEGHAHVASSALRSSAGGAEVGVGSSLDGDWGWDDGFQTMVEHARARGWISEAGSIRVHIEWGE